MHAGFTLAGMVWGGFFGFKTGFGGWALAGFIGTLVECIVGITIIGVASASGYPWAAAIGGFLLGRAAGSLANFFLKS